MKLHEIEQRHLDRTGKVVLWRLIELPETLPNSVFEYDHIPAGHFTISVYLRKFEVIHWESDHAETIPLPCPFGKAGDILATDGGPVRVVKVEAKKVSAVLSSDTRWCWRVEVEVVGK